jgi:hypothetical protein
MKGLMVVGGILGLLVLVITLASLDDIKRYAEIRSM